MLHWAETLGLDTARIIVVDGETAVIGRSCFEMVLGVPKEDKKTHVLVGKSKEGLLDKIMAGEFNINMVCPRFIRRYYSTRRRYFGCW